MIKKDIFKSPNPNIVTIGGGTGLSIFLGGLRNFPVNINAIVTVADDGGSSGTIRNVFNIPSPGDIRNVVVALSNAPKEINTLLQYRFDSEVDGALNLRGHTIGNIILAALTEIYDNNFNIAVKKLCKLLSINGRVIPVSCKNSNLCLRTVEGNVICGESNFSKNNKRIDRIFYSKNITANKDAIKAIQNADIIALGPGSLYTSIIPNILVENVLENINNNTKATIIYICNVMTEKGETQNYTVRDHMNALYKHGIKKIDKVIINNGDIPDFIKKNYQRDNCNLVINDLEDEILENRYIVSNFVQVIRNTVRHHPIKLAASVYSIALDKIN